LLSLLIFGHFLEKGAVTFLLSNEMHELEKRMAETLAQSADTPNLDLFERAP